MKKITKLIAVLLLPFFVVVSQVSANPNTSDTSTKINEQTFSCINNMQKVRGFFVDNLNKNALSQTVKVAKAGSGEYPAGSVVQLVPTEVMVKHPKGTSPKTNDWEFIELAVSANGSKFTARGFEDVKNRFGGNCLDCHKKARPEFDIICEHGHGCDPIPLTKEMLTVIQKTDPRCEEKQPLSEQELVLLKQLQQMLK